MEAGEAERRTETEAERLAVMVCDWCNSSYTSLPFENEGGGYYFCSSDCKKGYENMKDEIDEEDDDEAQE